MATDQRDLLQQRAIGEAEARVKKLTNASLPIDPFKFAEDADIIVQAKPDASAGVSGMLLRSGNAFGIMYATHVSSEGFQRFSVAHELGHYFLEGHLDQVLPDGDGVHESRAGFTSRDPHELEADAFAVGLLMPRHLFDKAMARYDDGLDAIIKLAEACKTSLTSTAIRYAQRARSSMAVVMSTGQVIDYCFMSSPLWDMKGLDRLRKGTTLPNGVETRRFNDDSRNVSKAARAEREVDLRDWFGGQRRLDGLEEVIGLGSYGKTLTVLTTSVAEDDEDEDEELKESWTPRFR